MIEEKFRLGAELRAQHALRTWGNTETSWKAGPALRSGPFTFSYRYQRADLGVAGPFPYGKPERLAGASMGEPTYTCSGMGAMSTVLLAIAETTDHSVLLHLPGCYKETLEFAAIAGFTTIAIDGTTHRCGSHRERLVVWLDSLPVGRTAAELHERVQNADLIVFDTTAFSAQSGRIGRFLHWARKARLPVILVRSHTKLDTLGIEYGRLGSAVFLAFPEVPLAKLTRYRQLIRKIPTLVRLLGTAPDPAHFCPFAGGHTYWQLTARRCAAMLKNGRLVARALSRQLGGPVVRTYGHELFAALVPPYSWKDGEAALEAELLATSLAAAGLPVRHAGSFGFDFVAVEGFFDTAVQRHLLRVAAADLPTAITAHIADGIAAWWARRWRSRVA